jgi:hypothetical protein
MNQGKVVFNHCQMPIEEIPTPPGGLDEEGESAVFTDTSRFLWPFPAGASCQIRRFFQKCTVSPPLSDNRLGAQKLQDNPKIFLYHSPVLLHNGFGLGAHFFGFFCILQQTADLSSQLTGILNL